MTNSSLWASSTDIGFAKPIFRNILLYLICALTYSLWLCVKRTENMEVCSLIQLCYSSCSHLKPLYSRSFFIFFLGIEFALIANIIPQCGLSCHIPSLGPLFLYAHNRQSIESHTSVINVRFT